MWKKVKKEGLGNRTSIPTSKLQATLNDTELDGRGIPITK